MATEPSSAARVRYCVCCTPYKTLDECPNRSAATPSWHEAFATELVGKTIAAAEYVEGNSYWLIKFTDGTELCVRLMADEAWHGRA